MQHSGGFKAAATWDCSPKDTKFYNFMHFGEILGENLALQPPKVNLMSAPATCKYVHTPLLKRMKQKRTTQQQFREDVASISFRRIFWVGPGIISRPLPTKAICMQFSGKIRGILG